MQHIAFLDGRSLTLKQLDQIIYFQKKIDLTEAAWAAVRKSRKAIDDMMADPDKVVYGVTTGFGSFANVSISKEDRDKLQVNLIRSHAVGVGAPVHPEIVKRMLVLRVNTLSKGRSGIRAEVIKQIIEAYNRGFLPKVPCQGTVGASGDLAPLAHLALGLMGQGLAYDIDTNSYSPAEQLLEHLGLTKVVLKQKQGLALINGTQFMASIISSVGSQIERLIHSSLTLYALFVQIFGIDRRLFSEQTESFYKQFNPELGQIIREIRGLIGEQESQMHKQRFNPEEVASFLDFPEALAGVVRIKRMANRMIEEEMNGATDNPLVYFKDEGFDQDQLISAGNFHGQYVAKASDFIGFALFDLGKFSEARIQRYINGKISRLPAFLVKKGGLNSGHMITQYTSAALLSESKVLVKPASADSIITSAGQEDYVSMGGFAARKCEMLVRNVSSILGIQLHMCLTAAHIFDIKCSPKLAEILAKVEKTIKPLDEDRFFGPEIEIASRLVSRNLQMI